MFGNFSLFKTPFPGWTSIPPSFVSFFCLLYFFLPPFKDLGCFSGCLMSSAGIQKLFCGIYSAFKCSFDEFCGGESVLPVLLLRHLSSSPAPEHHFSMNDCWPSGHLGITPNVMLEPSCPSLWEPTGKYSGILSAGC